jgi:hypothetical protein
MISKLQEMCYRSVATKGWRAKFYALDAVCSCYKIGLIHAMHAAGHPPNSLKKNSRRFVVNSVAPVRPGIKANLCKCIVLILRYLAV